MKRLYFLIVSKLADLQCRFENAHKQHWQQRKRNRASWNSGRWALLSESKCSQNWLQSFIIIEINLNLPMRMKFTTCSIRQLGIKINPVTLCLKILLEDALLKESFLCTTESGRIKLQLIEVHVVIRSLTEIRVEDKVDKWKEEPRTFAMLHCYLQKLTRCCLESLYLKIWIWRGTRFFCCFLLSTRYKASLHFFLVGDCSRQGMATIASSSQYWQ